MPQKTKFLYSVHLGVAMVQKWIADLPLKTGRSLEEWIVLVKKTGPPTEKERRQWLKQKHGLGTNSAWWIAERSDGKGDEEDTPEAYLKAAEGYVDAMFQGARSALRPLYEELLELGLAAGPDVKACPGKTIVPLYHNHVFAQIKPATNTRIDMGFAFGDMPPTGSLIDTGGHKKGDRITHRIPITKKAEITGEVKRWLKKAYERDR
jgi:hypothetical protein